MPLISNIATHTIHWTNPGTLPTSWQVWQAVSMGGPYSLLATITGSASSFGGLSVGDYYYIVGVDGGGNPVSDLSNVVQVLV